MRRLSGSRQVTVYSLSNRRASVAAVVTKPVNEKMGKRVDQYIFRAHLDFKTSPMLGGPVIRQGELGSALFNYLSFAPLLDALCIELEEDAFSENPDCRCPRKTIN